MHKKNTRDKLTATDRKSCIGTLVTKQYTNLLVPTKTDTVNFQIKVTKIGTIISAKSKTGKYLYMSITI